MAKAATKKKSAKKRQLVDADMIGETLHTALRKGLDNTFSVVAWNAIKLCPPVIWREYLHHLIPQTENVEKWGGHAMKRALGSWKDHYREDIFKLFGETKARPAKQEIETDDGTLDLNNAIGWGAMLSYLFAGIDGASADALAAWFNHCIAVWNGEED